MLVRFKTRAQIVTDDGASIFGQEGQEADIDGEALEKALAADEVEIIDTDALEQAAAEKAAAAKKPAAKNA
jgi:flagellar basal body rod protein FlgG